MVHTALVQKRLPSLLGETLITLDWPVLITVVDQRGSIIFASPSYQSLLGSDPADLIGCSTFALAHPEDVDELAATYALALRQGIARHSFRLRCQDGSYLWMEASVLRTSDTTDQALLILVAQDVTERRALESQLPQMQKWETVGRLAGGIAHDFNNLLTGIAGMAELPLHMLPPDHPIYGNLVAIQESTTRAATFVDQLLAFVRQREIEPQIFALNDLVCEMASFLQRLIGTHRTIIARPSSKVSMIRADPVQIQQVVLNLVVNARDAMPEGGQITIETANTTLDATADHDGGDYVVLRVSDTGTGILPEVQSRIFEPFFTTKEPGKGTGLGLATSSRIVKQYGGTIQVQSAPGRGTTIEVYLPSALSSDSVYQEVAPGDLPGGTETVLLMEHEASVREVVARVLREQGYNVLEAANGLDALLLARSHSGVIHVLITDVVMPDMHGSTLARLLIEACPDVRVIYISSHDKPILQTPVAGWLLHKPFTPADVAHLVRLALDTASGKGCAGFGALTTMGY